jgi:hypothetical protein
MLKFFLKKCWCVRIEEETENMQLFKNEAWYRQQAINAKKTFYPPGLDKSTENITDTGTRYYSSDIR